MSGSFPQELIELILLKLPIPSLAKFTSVCKSWNSLVTSQDFIDSHLSVALSIPPNSNPTLFAYSTVSHPFEHYSLHFDPNSFADHQSIPFPFPSPPEEKFGYHLVGTIHGLICLANYRDEVYIWNPMVRRYIQLPPPKLDSKTWNFLPNMTEFAFDPVKNDYKVVRISYGFVGIEIELRAEIWSLKERSWREIEQAKAVVKPYTVLRFDPSQCFVHEAVHWIESDLGTNSILLFNISSESFSTLELPEQLFSERAWDLRVLEFNGLLAVAHYRHERESGVLFNCCDIWVMREYGVRLSWTKIYEVSGLAQLKVVSRMNGYGDIMMLKVAGESDDASEIVFYDPVNNSIQVRNDYKVLRMVYTRTLGHSEVPPKVEVYSLRERLWREISADGLETCVYRYDLSQCYLNGAVHWVAYENGRTCIMLFDVFHERFCKMELPNDLINEWALSISEIKGCVGVIHYKCVAVEGKAAKCPEIWVMKEYGVHHSWAKIYSFHGKVDIELVLGMSGNCNILFAKNETVRAACFGFSAIVAILILRCADAGICK
ncbi:hypothetical protein K2173_007096 [Erythroxylum novogranatense]|uniref:F-box domain-containing protein n=1 Tax=Erythroxylum novogranatense TaxID=1862640 RepID=A0AAV8SZI3_9ROSI|nr:hypothetical protein K2173_007096 [Erythroxylum novogranatense]